MSVDTEHTQSSSSSAVELIPSPATIPRTPTSPSLLPSPDSRNSFARRRLSWARADEAGPLAMNDPGPSSPRPSASSQPIPTVYALDDDPFVTSISRPNLVTPHYDDPDPFAYPSDSQARASSASLISASRRDSSPTSSAFDDSTHLTATLSTSNMNPDYQMGVSAANNDHDRDDWRTDSEQHMFGDATPRTRRRLEQRYTANLTPSPLQRSGTAIKRISQGLRRVSWRVVNFAGAGFDDHIRLPDGGDQVDATGDGRRPSADNYNDAHDRSVQPFADLGRNVLSLRGRTLCLFGPTSRVRRAMYGFLIFPCVFRVYLRSYLTVAHIPQMDRTSHSLFDYFLCRLAIHTILSHHHIVESKRKPASRTRVLSYVGRLYHLCPVRFL
jgi:hypothetical protein